ncbi:MAG: helix-turn-helix transcriptional regulator [Sedimentisphaerales bacterium]
MTKRKSQTKSTEEDSILVKLEKFLKSQKIKQAEFARRIGVSPATICLFLQDKYPGDNGKLTKEVTAEIDTARDLPKRYKRYITVHLGEECVEYNSIIEEIRENEIHPSRNENPKERIAFLQKFADEKLDYIGQVVADLKKLK